MRSNESNTESQPYSLVEWFCFEQQIKKVDKQRTKKNENKNE